MCQSLSSSFSTRLLGLHAFYVSHRGQPILCVHSLVDHFVDGNSLLREFVEFILSVLYGITSADFDASIHEQKFEAKNHTATGTPSFFHIELDRQLLLSFVQLQWTTGAHFGRIVGQQLSKKKLQNFIRTTHKRELKTIEWWPA